ncbi:amidase [Pseudovibrio japonicus]|uniref:Amidase n=1 Tax=Pseudovibrio japonicus TaxID=366534 RepID=A0ABQ3E4X5_9HYPH|nr:amidase family protein [Pseudovibrio japonicus]GHB23220.1 amidase [Pseudovibrio japonicus]
MSLGNTKARCSRVLLRAQDRVARNIDRVIDIGPEEASKIFTNFDADEVVRSAARLDKAVRRGKERGPLFGTTISIKDLIDEEGKVTTAGCSYYCANPPAAKDAPSIQRLKASGAVLFGRTNTSQLAYSGMGINPDFGTPGNAIDPSRIPGGSSTGAAVGVALGLFDAGLGSDTGGSIRIPAAFNGVCGFKPTARTVPMKGLFPLSRDYDSIGPLGGSIELCTQIYRVLSGQVRPPRSNRKIGDLRLALIDPYVTEGLDKQVGEDFERVLNRLGEKGAKVEKVTIPEIVDAIWVNEIFIYNDGYAFHKKHLEGLKRCLIPESVSYLLEAQKRTPAEVEEARQLRAKAIESFERIAPHYDAFISPTCRTVAPPISEATAAMNASHFVIKVAHNTMIGNMVDGCAATIPMQEPGKLGTGLMVLGAGGSDWETLEVAALLEDLLKSH